MSFWARCKLTHYQLIGSDWVYWLLFTAYSTGTDPFENAISFHFLSTNAQLSWSFPLPHTNIHTDQSMWREALHTKRILGVSFVERRLLNHIGLVSINSSSLDIRWPPSFHMSFLFYDEWGVRHTMLSGIPIQDSMQQHQKNRSLSTAIFFLTCTAIAHILFFFFF